MKIKLFVSDIDGCLSEPYPPFDLEGFRELAAYATRYTVDRPDPEGRHPALSLCSGRPLPYVEALSQLLGLTAPVLFENGGGLFDPVRGTVTWNPQFTDVLRGQMDAVTSWLLTDCLPGSTMRFDHAKRTQAGMITPDLEEVSRMLPRVTAYVQAHFPRLQVFYTPVSIDVLPPGITKDFALSWLALRMGVDLSETAYIGDSNGDIAALRSVGYSFAPANASDDVKEAVRQVTRASVLDGVLEAYRWCLDENSEDEAAGRASAA
jgi:HAD superfamily hydrolase (TIGR01484 family)